MNTAIPASDWSNSKEVFVIFQTTRRFFVIPLVSAIVAAAGYAAQADDAAKRTFAFCDKNKDGKLDAGELDAIPVSMRDWLALHGPKSKTGLTQADFLKVYPKMMADLRTQTRVASSSGQPARAADPDPDPQPAKIASTTTGSPPLYASTPPSDEIVETVPPSNLPASYQDADLDKDGQIDYFEWRKAKLGDFAKFQELDLNNDSVLSAQELAVGGTAGGSTSSTPATSSVGSTGGPSSNRPRFGARPSVPSGPSPEYVEQVKFYFKIMDKDKGNGNGKLDPNEWSASKRIKPAFEKAGIDISKPMDEKTFIMHYSKVFPEVKKTAPRIGFGARPGAFTPAAKAPGRKRNRGNRRRGN
jgi:EF hand